MHPELTRIDRFGYENEERKKKTFLLARTGPGWKMIKTITNERANEMDIGYK